MSSRKVVKLEKYYTQNQIKKRYIKKRYFYITFVLLIVSSSLLIYFTTTTSNALFPNNDIETEEEISNIGFDLRLMQTDDPVDLKVYIENIFGENLTLYFKLDGLIEYQEIEEYNNTKSYYFTINHDYFYDLINQRNNTLTIKAQDESFALSKSLNFNLTLDGEM